MKFFGLISNNAHNKSSKGISNLHIESLTVLCGALNNLLTLVNTLFMSVPKSQVESICRNQYPPRPCGGGWYLIDSKRCAKYVKLSKTYQRAEVIQTPAPVPTLGGHLVSMHNKDDYSNVLCLALRTTNDRKVFWTGAYYSYAWRDRSPFNFNRWFVGQPDKLVDRCVQMNYGDWGSWDNTKCWSKKFFVCARAI
uniref:C-type lectin domain-containing protein n=1 Tax=Mola mola TaxID=94237 RepID=A0A3Q3VR08_MOLML